MLKPFRSPILPPIDLSSPPTKKIRISRCVSNAEPQFLQPNLHPVVTAKKKRSACTFEVKDAVYKAVKRDGVSLAHAASVFLISGGKSAAQNIVPGGPYDELVGFQLCRLTSHIMLQLKATVMAKAMLRQNLPVSRLVIDIISSNDMCLLQLHVDVKNHHSTCQR